MKRREDVLPFEFFSFPPTRERKKERMETSLSIFFPFFFLFHFFSLSPFSSFERAALFKKGPSPPTPAADRSSREEP